MTKQSDKPQVSSSSQAEEAMQVPFDEFSTATYEEWKTAAIDALKGVPFEKMIAKQIEGFSLQPIYNPSDVAGLENSPIPGQFNYLRGTKSLGYNDSPWLIAQNIPAVSPADFNDKILADLQNGQNAINITLDPNGLNGLALNSAQDWECAFNGIDLEAIPVFISPGKHGIGAQAAYINYAQKSQVNLEKLTGGILQDPLGTLVSSGSLPSNLEQNFSNLYSATVWTIKHAPLLQTISASGIPYADAGADAAQEIAFIVATGVEYVRKLVESGLCIDDIAPKIRFQVSLGNHLFLEIAKIRALREIWAQVIKAFDGSEESAKIQIHGRTSGWSISKTDPWVNMLRATAQTFSGILGGCDSIDVQPFDSAIRVSDEFARRIARNTQLVLQLECDLNKVADPAGGSWYVEWATNELAAKAWKMFQEIEESGGMAKAILAGKPQKMVAETAAKRYSMIDSRRQVVVGTNKYTNLTEKELDPTIEPVEVTEINGNIAVADGIGQKMPSRWMCASIDAVSSGASIADITASLASGSAQPNITTAEQLPVLRASARFEELHQRAKSYCKKNGKRPEIFLATMGPLRQFKARADFAQDFLRAGGLDTIYPNGFADVEAAVDAAVKSGSKACVICSTDDTYPEIVPAFCSAIKKVAPDIYVLLAGYPTEHVEAFKSAGVDDFIHVRANCYETLNSLQNKLGL